MKDSHMRNMTQLFPGKVITTVSYGTSELGYPIVLIATAEGDIVTLAANGNAVFEEFNFNIIQSSEKGKWTDR
jgi:hypothetical protein